MSSENRPGRLEVDAEWINWEHIRYGQGPWPRKTVLRTWFKHKTFFFDDVIEISNHVGEEYPIASRQKRKRSNTGNTPTVKIGTSVTSKNGNSLNSVWWRHRYYLQRRLSCKGCLIWLRRGETTCWKWRCMKKNGQTDVDCDKCRCTSWQMCRESPRDKKKRREKE